MPATRPRCVFSLPPPLAAASHSRLRSFGAAQIHDLDARLAAEKWAFTAKLAVVEKERDILRSTNDALGVRVAELEAQQRLAHENELAVQVRPKTNPDTSSSQEDVLNAIHLLAPLRCGRIVHAQARVAELEEQNTELKKLNAADGAVVADLRAQMATEKAVRHNGEKTIADLQLRAAREAEDIDRLKKQLAALKAR